MTPPTDTTTQPTLVPTTDDDNWPPPPSPISEARAAAAARLSCGGGEERSETAGSSSPVMRFTFTVKLDSQLLKRRRRQWDDDEKATDTSAAAAAQLAVEDVATAEDDDDDDDDPTPSASPPQTRPTSSKHRPPPPAPEMAVVIPDVVVCADAVDNRKQGVVEQPPALRQYCVQVVPSAQIDPASQSKQQQHRGCTASRSCQTELSEIPAAAQSQPCSCSCSKNSPGTASPAASDGRDDVVGLDGSDDVDQLSCRCSSLLDDDDGGGNDDDDLWLQPEVSRRTGGVRVDDGSYLRPLVTRVYPAVPDRSDVTTKDRGGEALADGELTHMSWSEVLKEAQTMGIPLHLRTMSAAYAERQRHPSCSASSTVTSASATPVKRVPDDDNDRRRRTTKPTADSGSKNKKTPSTPSLSGIKTSFRDLLRLPQLFGRKKSSAASSSDSRVRRSRSMEPARQKVVQARCLPTPPNNQALVLQRHQRDVSAADSDRTRHWVMSRTSRYSASSCPSTSSTRCHHRSRSRHAVDYCPGAGGSTSWATSSCSGSLPAYRHRCTAAAAGGAGFDVMDEMVVSVDDVVCASPSMSSFSSVCTAPWRTRHGAVPPPTLSNSVTSSSLASPGQSANLS